MSRNRKKIVKAVKAKRKRRLQQERKTSDCENTRERPLRGAAYWQDRLDQLLSEFGAVALPDLGTPDDRRSKKGLIATRVRRKYVVRRIRQLKKDKEEPQLSEQVNDFLGQARLQTKGAYWREVDQEFHTRGVFML